jgi:hypothetical protein
MPTGFNQINQESLDLNIFAITFKGMKEAEENISGGDPYSCVKCKAVLNKFSKVKTSKDLGSDIKVEVKNNESLW